MNPSRGPVSRSGLEVQGVGTPSESTRHRVPESTLDSCTVVLRRGLRRAALGGSGGVGGPGRWFGIRPGSCSVGPGHAAPTPTYPPLAPFLLSPPKIPLHFLEVALTMLLFIDNQRIRTGVWVAILCPAEVVYSGEKHANVDDAQESLQAGCL